MQKITFNDRYGLTTAVLEGWKTMTRRIEPALKDPNIVDISEMYLDDKGKAFVKITYDTGLTEDVYPKYQPGEIVAVAQRYQDVPINMFPAERYAIEIIKSSMGWNNKMYVSPRFMPNKIQITNVRIEHLQDINNEDIMREGIREGEFMNTWDRFYYDVWGDVANHITFRTPREAFASLIDKVSRRGTWASNPWVFPYEFKLLK